MTWPRSGRGSSGAVEDLRLPYPGNPPHRRVTISIGVATVGREDLAADDDDWFARADEALFLAKAAGRNRSMAADPDVPHHLKVASA